MNILRAEMLKYKRTFMAKLVIFIPLFFAAYSLVTSYLLPYAYNWNGILVLSFNWWPVTFLPLGFALFAGMVANQERRAGAGCQGHPDRMLWSVCPGPHYDYLSRRRVLLPGEC